MPAGTPGCGGLGPDLCRADADLRRCIESLLAYDDPGASLAAVLLDQRVFCGLGNVYRSEVLWAGEWSPWAPVGDLPETDAVRLVNVAATLLRANLRRADRIDVTGGIGGFAVYGRSGQGCRRCGTTIQARRSGEEARTLYWCPGCQVRFEPRPARPAEPPMDRHPAAAQFLADLPWRRPA